MRSTATRDMKKLTIIKGQLTRLTARVAELKKLKTQLQTLPRQRNRP
jgi:hypothetical protein